MADHSQIEDLFAQICDDDGAASITGKRELWNIVRHSGRPDAAQERRSVAGQLVGLLGKDSPTSARRELLWMLSEIGGDESVDAVAARLADAQLREDARMSLQRIPGDKSLAALKAGLKAAPDEFKPNLAQSLRRRGVTVPGHSCQKAVPTRQTSVKAIDA